MTRKMCINCQCGIMVFLNLNCPSSIHSSPSFILHFPFSIINFPSSYIKSSLTILNSSSSTLLPPSSVKRTRYLTQKVHCYQLFPALILGATLHLDPAHWTCTSGLYFVILYFSYILESCQFQPFTLIITQKDFAWMKGVVSYLQLPIWHKVGGISL